MQDIYSTFEFDKIKDFIYQYSKTERGREYVLSLEMITDFDELNNKLEDLKEVLSLITRYGEMPIEPSFDALRLIDEAKKTGILSPRDLDMIAQDVLTSVNLYSFIKKVELMYPRIKKKISSFFDLTNLEKEIHRVISSAQAVKDDASPELLAIRRKIKKTEQLLQEKISTIALAYSSYLNGDNATIREGHLVLPIKTAYKNKVGGIVYDVSDSGNTTFMEPLEIVQINNELTSLRVMENDEVRKILKALTALCLLQEGEIIANNEIIAELDFLSAKAMYAREIDADIAELTKESFVHLEKARHPLIDRNKVVANTYHLEENKRIVIISGPNAGGKTVSLKTVGLLTLMNQCGLAIPALKAKLGLFKHIFIDIGDNQSLSDNLSTFSAHMSHIGEIVSLIGGKDLLLIDELGTGTDPKEGEALALGITKFLEKKKCLAMISSHFDALKEYAFLNESLDNSSMLFDEENLLPTYIFRQGAPGKSYALDVATRYGIDKEIVKDAKDYLTSKGSDTGDELTSILLKKINEASKLEKELKAKEESLNRQEKKLNNDTKMLNEKRDHLLEEVNDKKEKMLKDAKEEIDDIISKLSNSDLKLHEVIELKHKLEELEEAPEEYVFDEEIKEGDYVSIPSLDMNGKVMRINGNKAKIQSDAGFSFDTDVSKLHKVERKVEEKVKVKKTEQYERIINTSLSLELNLIGLYVDEAIPELEKYLDACRMKHLSTVRIIHGYGSGALRNAVRKYLDKQKDLTYRPGNEHEGGGGATVINFK